MYDVSEGSLRFGVTCVGPYVAFSVLGVSTIVTAEKATAQIDHTDHTLPPADLREQTETGIDWQKTALLAVAPEELLAAASEESASPLHIL